MLTCASFPRCIERLQWVRDSARHPTSVFAPLSHYSARVQVAHPILRCEDTETQIGHTAIEWQRQNSEAAYTLLTLWEIQ